MPACPLHKHHPGQSLGHVGIVEFGEAEGRLAQLAVLFVGVTEPFHQAVLVHKLDAARAFAWVEERLIETTLAATNAAGVHSLRARVHSFKATTFAFGFGGESIAALERGVVDKPVRRWVGVVHSRGSGEVGERRFKRRLGAGIRWERPFDGLMAESEANSGRAGL